MNQLYTKVIPTSNLSAKKIDELAARYYGNGAGKKEKILWIVIGPPGSGKSSRAVVPLQKYHDALVLDSDHIKPLIPNFHKGYGCNAVHGDSMKVVFKALYEKALENGDNIVYPTTGGDEERMRTFIQQAKEKGYKVGLSLVDIETKEARQRVLNRSCEKDKDGNVQIVTTDYVDSVGKKPARVYEALKDSVDYAFSADTTGLRKQDPLNITDCSDSTIDILRAMYKK
jgi:predicted ABC-type ATPase